MNLAQVYVTFNSIVQNAVEHFLVNAEQVAKSVRNLDLSMWPALEVFHICLAAKRNCKLGASAFVWDSFEAHPRD